MKKWIVVPIDGSAYAHRALQYAIQIAQGLDGEIVLLNIQPDFSHAPNVKKFFSEEEIRDYQEKLGREALAGAIETMEETSLDYSVSIRSGSPAVEICNEAKERGAAGIVMGTRGMGPIRGAILGSVSYGVLHNAPCPVTLVS